MNYLCKIELYGAKQRTPKKKKRQAAKATEKRVRKAIEGFRQDNLRNLTRAEIEFEEILKKYDFKYTAQKIIKTSDGFKIADFYLDDYQLVIEIDGGYHETTEQKLADRKRTKVIENRSKAVIRFTNDEISKNPVGVIKQIVIKVCPESEYFMV